MTNNDIIVQFNGQAACLPGLTRFTTCDDVIEMVLFGRGENSHSYGIFESFCGVERQLNGRDSILKVIRSWVSDLKFVLVVRKTDTITSKLVKISKARRQLEKMRCKLVPRRDGDVSDNQTINNNLNKGHVKNLKPKVIATSEVSSKIKRHRGKVDLMKRFLQDVITHSEQQTTKVSVSRSLLRRSAEGENSYVSRDEVDFLNNAIDSESAFEDDSDCSSVCDLERNILEHDVESSCDSDSADHVNSTERIVTADNVDSTVLRGERIRKMFSGSDLTDSGSDNQDADMESFMKTFVWSVDSDEGRGSSHYD